MKATGSYLHVLTKEMGIQFSVRYVLNTIKVNCVGANMESMTVYYLPFLNLNNFFFSFSGPVLNSFVTNRTAPNVHCSTLGVAFNV